MAKKKKKKQASPPVLQPAVASVALPEWFTNRRLHVAVVFVLSFLLYANTLTHQFALDDAIVIQENMFTTQGIEGIPGILQYDTFYGFFKEEGKARLVAGGRYRPLSLVIFALEVELFGLSPFAGHLINALFYGCTAVVLYWLMLALFRPREQPDLAYFVALSASLLFAAHPLHTEVAANIKGLDEILTLLCSLGALLLSLRAYREKHPVLNAVAGLVFFLGLMSKENAITFLAIVPLAYFFFTNARPKQIAVQTLPFVAAAVLFLIIRFSILGWGFGDPPSELMNNPFLKLENGRYIPFSGSEKLATVTHTLGRYLQLLFIPHPLTHDYYPRHIGIMSWGDWRVLLSLLAYLALTGYAIRQLPKKDPVSFGILFYLITLSIVSNLVFAVGTNMAERLLFMPSVGFCLVIALLAYRLVTKGQPSPALRKLNMGLAGIGLIVLLFGTLTLLRNPAWKDNYTLFTTDVAVSQNSAKLRNAVGGELIAQSIKVMAPEQKHTMLTEATGHLQEAIRIHPTYKNAWLLLGNAYNYLQDFEQSIASYQQALALDPNYQEAINNLGITYRDAGRYYGEQKGDLTRSIQYLEQAYAMRPDEYETVRLLGVAYGIQGNTAKAVEFFRKGVTLNPEDADAWFNLGSAYYNAGDAAQGQECHQKALQLDPGILERRRQGGG